MFDFSILLPPAIIISILAFFVHLFGKVSTDHAPYADDRKWKREISGVLFILLHIVTPVAGICLINKLIIALRNQNSFQFVLDFILQFILLAIVVVIILSFGMINRKTVDFINKNKSATSDKNYHFQKSLFSSFTFFIMLFIIMLNNWGEYLYMLLAGMYLFIHLLGFAIYLSLKDENISIADIYFIKGSGEQPIKECRILKINDDNVRIIKDGIVMVINKSQILKIEEKIS